MSKPRIIIEVLGGVVQSVYADEPVEVQVLDWDNVQGGASDDEIADANKLEDEAQKLNAYL